MANKDLSGIFAARVVVRSGEAPYLAAVFADPSRLLLEAHILDFNDDLYGMEIEIVLLKKIRDRERYDNDAKLRAAIEDDISRVREYGATHVLGDH